MVSPVGRSDGWHVRLSARSLPPLDSSLKSLDAFLSVRITGHGAQCFHPETNCGTSFDTGFLSQRRVKLLVIHEAIACNRT